MAKTKQIENMKGHIDQLLDLKEAYPEIGSTFHAQIVHLKNKLIVITKTQ